MIIIFEQVIIAQWLARRLANGEVLGSNPGKEKYLINSNLSTIIVWVYELTGLFACLDVIMEPLLYMSPVSPIFISDTHLGRVISQSNSV